MILFERLEGHCECNWGLYAIHTLVAAENISIKSNQIAMTLGQNTNTHTKKIIQATYYKYTPFHELNLFPYRFKTQRFANTDASLMVTLTYRRLALFKLCQKTDNGDNIVKKILCKQQ